MSERLFQQFEAYCLDSQCGDPIATTRGEVYFSKRRMVYAGRSLLGSWLFRCPVCGKKRGFHLSFFGNTICED
ncbi:MAG TPA: hypothetical protein PLB10_03960 [Thiolinea sp.]|nr:hypothetical protein [Thiolinea sp.]